MFNVWAFQKIFLASSYLVHFSNLGKCLARHAFGRLPGLDRRPLAYCLYGGTSRLNPTSFFWKIMKSPELVLSLRFRERISLSLQLFGWMA